LGTSSGRKVNRICVVVLGYVSTAAEHGQTLRDLSQSTACNFTLFDH
jgi:hypothetical protein